MKFWFHSVPARDWEKRSFSKCNVQRRYVEMERFELLTPCLQGRCSPNWATPPWMRAFPLSRRSLIHFCSVFISISQSLPALPFWVMGLSGLEPPTSRLSGVRSNRLSYKPIEIWHPPALPCRLQHSTIGRSGLNRRVRDGNGCFPWAHRHQKIFSFIEN